MNNVVPAIDEWAAASACTPGRLAGVEPGAAALASADPCHGSNGGRGVGHGPLTCVFMRYAARVGGAGRPTACLLAQSPAATRQIHRAPLPPARAPLSADPNSCIEKKKTARTDAHRLFTLYSGTERVRSCTGPRPAPVEFLLCAPLDAARAPSGQDQRMRARRDVKK